MLISKSAQKMPVVEWKKCLAFHLQLL